MAGIPARYEACWIPGLRSGLDPDEVIRLGGAWLASRTNVHSRIVVMNAKKMMGNSASLGWLAGLYPFVSPLTRVDGDPPRAVLAVYPASRTLALAERLALDGALCVIPGTFDDAVPWITRARAKNLVAPDDPPPSPPLVDPGVADILRDICRLGADDDFVWGDDIEYAILGLRQIAALPCRPAASELEELVLSTGRAGVVGARRLRGWYQAILEGRRLRGDRGQYI